MLDTQRISIVIPVLNEEKSITPLYQKIQLELKGFNKEIIFINDGSSDDSFNVIKSIINQDSNVKMISFFKQIFIWWHKQTIGTFLYTLLFGKYSGEDQFGNKYYSDSKGKRWVIYKNNIEASKIPPEWHLWIHFLARNVPDDKNKKFSCKNNIRKI